MKTYISKFVAMPSNDEGVFMLVHITDGTPDTNHEDIASVIGPVVKEEDSEGTYYVMPKSEGVSEEDAESTVLMAFHESRVQESTVAWEIFRAVVSGKIKKDVTI